MASTPKFFDRVKESTTTTGTGTLTLAGAVTGFQAFSKLGNGNSCLYTIQAVDANGNPSGAWEVGVGTYTLSGTTLSRDAMLDSSNAGALVDFAAGTKHVWIDFPSTVAQPDHGVCQGRLTTETGVPVSTTDRTAQGTLYFTPYRGNCIGVYHNGDWYRVPFVETSLSLAGVTSGKNYDVFVYFNIVAGGFTLTLELSAEWTNNTTRADALALQDGVLVKSGTPAKRWLGTIRASGANVTEDSGGGVTINVGGKRFVWNAYNQVARFLAVMDTTDQWTYATNTIRQARAQAGNQVEYVTGDIASYVSVTVISTGTLEGFIAQNMTAGVGVDSTTAYSGLTHATYSNINTSVILTSNTGFYNGTPGLGYHYLAWLERGVSDSGSTSTFYGDNVGLFQTGLRAQVYA